MGLIDEAREELVIEKQKTDFEEVKRLVINCLLMQQKREATEIISNYIIQNEKIYTTREDEKNQCWIYKEGIYIPNGKTYIKEISRTFLSKNYTTHLMNEIILKVETDTFIEQGEFFEVRDIYKLALNNGVFDIKTKELLPFSPDYFFFNKLPFNYNHNAKCEQIIKFFSEILPNKDDVEIIQELFGFLLLKEYRFEKAFMLTGSGRNGKGKTVELIKRFLGIDNTVNIPLQSLKDESYNVSELHNKLANIGADISNTVLKETGMFKSLTGRDLMSAQRKYLTRVKFTNYAKMVFCANELPITFDKTLAFFNRWIILDFPYTFLPQSEIDKIEGDKTFYKLQDTTIIDKISTEKELEGLFNWALIGFDRIIKNNSFSYCKGTEDVKMIWIRKSSSISAFMEDFLEEDYDSKIQKKELRHIYSYYCRIHKIKAVSDVIIKTELTKTLGVTEYRYNDGDSRINSWDGIKFKDDTPFGQGGQDGHGFSTLGDFQKNLKGEKRYPPNPPCPKDNIIEEKI